MSTKDTDIDWILMKSRRETPCCAQAVRVKIVEPGPQVRKCQLCKAVNWFVLEPFVMELSTIFHDRLRMRWLSDTEAEEMIRQGEADLADVELEDL